METFHKRKKNFLSGKKKKIKNKKLPTAVENFIHHVSNLTHILVDVNTFIIRFFATLLRCYECLKDHHCLKECDDFRCGESPVMSRSFKKKLMTFWVMPYLELCTGSKLAFGANPQFSEEGQFYHVEI